MNCEARQEQYLLEAAGLLDRAEAEALRAHLASGCPRCAGFRAEAQALAAHLPLALPPVDPSPAVRERFLARVQAQAPVRLRHRASWSEAWLRPLLAAAAAAVLTWFVIAPQAARREAAMRAELRDQLAAQTTKIERLEAQLTEAATTVGLLRAPGLLVVDLRGTETQPTASARILWDRDNATWHLFATNLEPAGPGKTYELWFITADQQKVRAGIFDADQHRGAHLVVPVPASLGPVALAAVTDEPAGGVDQPTGKIQLVGTVPSTTT